MRQECETDTAFGVLEHTFCGFFLAEVAPELAERSNGDELDAPFSLCMHKETLIKIGVS
jgi:hypothetical protein